MFEVVYTDRFKDDVKRYKKKYPKIKEDIDPIVKDLEKGKLLGDPIADIHLPDDENVYKVRVANTSANAGKSNGFRLIYYVIKNDSEIYLLTVYSKKDKEDIPNIDIIQLIKEYCS